MDFNDPILLLTTLLGAATINIIVLLSLLVTKSRMAKARLKAEEDFGKLQLQRGKLMANKQLNGISSALADGIVDVLEDLVHTEKISRPDANKIYRKLAFQLGIWDLHPRKIDHLPVPDPETVKERIRMELASMGKPVLIPDGEPLDPMERALLGFVK